MDPPQRTRPVWYYKYSQRWTLGRYSAGCDDRRDQFLFPSPMVIERVMMLLFLPFCGCNLEGCSDHALVFPPPHQHSVICPAGWCIGTGSVPSVSHAGSVTVPNACPRWFSRDYRSIPCMYPLDELDCMHVCHSFTDWNKHRRKSCRNAVRAFGSRLVAFQFLDDGRSGTGTAWTNYSLPMDGRTACCLLLV